MRALRPLQLVVVLWPRIPRVSLFASQTHLFTTQTPSRLLIVLNWRFFKWLLASLSLVQLILYFSAFCSVFILWFRFRFSNQTFCSFRLTLYKWAIFSAIFVMLCYDQDIL